MAEIATSTASGTQERVATRTWVYTALLVLVLLAGGYLRVVGLHWGEYQYLHPDERFLIWVGTDISPVHSLSEYWDTAHSTLNPNNVGHSFYVYGTLPMFLTRYVVQWVYGHSGFNEMTDVGRALSALADLSTVLLVFLAASHVFDRRVGILAAALSAFAVLQIQHAHFFTMDTFTTFFSTLTIYFAVRIGVKNKGPSGDGRNPPEYRSEGQGVAGALSNFLSHPWFWLSIGFGVALGMAVASKINAAPLAFLLPVAMLARLYGLPHEEQRGRVYYAVGYLALAGFTSLLVFRIFQPYAFSGPGFFGLKPNPQWIANLRELRSQASGNADFPPALQWARRPVTFAWKNMVLWGMGLPMGLLAWAGFLWAGWRMLHGEWKRHILLWGWTAVYFTWQSLVFNPSMRYQLLVYPTLAIFAAWAVVRLYDEGRQRVSGKTWLSGHWKSFAAVLVGGFVLLTTAAYAYGFTRIYVRPITRIAASRWIYQNIPGPVNLPIQTSDGVYHQPLSIPYDYLIQPDLPYAGSFVAKATGIQKEIQLGQVIDPRSNAGPKELSLTFSELPDGSGQAASGSITADLNPQNQEEAAGQAYAFALDRPFVVTEGQVYYLRLNLFAGQGPVTLSGNLGFEISSDQGITEGSISLENVLLGSASPQIVNFTAQDTGELGAVRFNPAAQPSQPPQPQQLTIQISSQASGEQPLGTATLTDTFAQPQSGNGEGIILPLSQPVSLVEGQPYYLTITIQGGSDGVILKGIPIANEGAWDDGLPVRLDGYDGFGGIYPPGINFDMYEDDNPRKLDRFFNILDESDYLLISSSRQWASLTRLPERFPMNTEYYRRLLGCPPERTVESCYNVAQPGTFKGDLGFDLVKVFQSDPTIGPIRINDQASEEAFTVYDHPKVFIFRKSSDYDSQAVHEILGSVDLTKVVHVTPKSAGALPRDMMLPATRLASEYEGGTWSKLFDTQSLLNSKPVFGLILWYLTVAVLGLFAYPLVRYVLSGLPDRGYPLARTAGLLVSSYLVWLAGSFRIPFDRLTISLVMLLLAVFGGYLAYRQRDELRQEWRDRKRYFLLIEGLFLAFFAFDLIIRLGNPDLWHPWKGGEKPMDFSFFNAVLKSTSFPPYDPWFEGGYINYYYYGFVLVGVLVKWLGIVPSIAYNLILPTVFALIAMGAFSLAWNLIAATRPLFKRSTTAESGPDPGGGSANRIISSLPFIGGIGGALGMAVFGNLGTLRMIYQGYQKLAAPGGSIEGAGALTRLVWALQGVGKVLAGATLPYGISDWYWNPSRVIPAPNEVEPITEFPFFTVLYGDPHAHLFALPLTLLAASWALSVLLGKAWLVDTGEKKSRSPFQVALGFAFGGLAIGVLRPTNTWDWPTYLAIGAVALGYVLWRNFRPESERLAFLSGLPAVTRRLMITLGGVLLLVVLAILFFQPYAEWYVQGYNAVDLWKGTHTPVSAYLTHWGLFLFVIVSWMAWETRQWMASTPLASLRKLSPYRSWIQVGVVLLLAAIAGLLFIGVRIVWLVLPLAVWAGVLIFRPGQPDSKRAVLFLIGTGLFLTLLVEVIVLRGDIARMNTVFKFYLQAWTLFAISAAAAFGWLLKDLRDWLPGWRTVFQFGLAVLVASASLYTLLGSTAKMKDRMAPDAPHTLDGMTFMKYATLDDLNTQMDLSHDYRAIRWMQENIPGSPVIVEANMVEYHWATRFTIYTGLPGVVGWNWHERQQRARAPENLVPERVNEVDGFYLTEDIAQAREFLSKYDVSYIIVGELERANYPVGLDKFSAYDGSLWNTVYRDGDTVIYRVNTAAVALQHLP